MRCLCGHSLEVHQFKTGRCMGICPDGKKCKCLAFYVEPPQSRPERRSPELQLNRLRLVR